MKKKTKKSKPAISPLGKASIKMRKQLMAQLKGVDANILISIVRQGERQVSGLAQRLSDDGDWSDTYNRNTWYKTWGKSDLADLPASAEVIDSDE